MNSWLGLTDFFFGGMVGALRWLNEGNWVKGSMLLFYSGEEGFVVVALV